MYSRFLFSFFFLNHQSRIFQHIFQVNWNFYLWTLFFQKMLEYLKDKKDVGFFLSVQTLMQTCRSAPQSEVLLDMSHMSAHLKCFFFSLQCSGSQCL